MTTIPLIDISKARLGNLTDKQAVAKQMDQASRDIGFFIISGHGIDDVFFEQAYADSARFFALPLALKNACRTDIIPCSHQHNGYASLLEENSHAYMGRPNLPGDLVEKFSMGKSILDDTLTLPFPTEQQTNHFRQSMKNYFHQCFLLSDLLSQLFSLAVGLPADFFADKIDQSFDFLRFHSYPGSADISADMPSSDHGISEHTDGTLFSIVADNNPGLEVKTRQGQWIRVETIQPNQLVVNIGDTMMRWSNDEWISTTHRVALSQHARQSLVFFKNANEDALIDAFEQFCRDRPAKYPPIINADWMNQTVKALYQGKKQGKKQGKGQIKKEAV